MNTEQIDFWKGKFGSEYTARNTYSQAQWDQFYIDTWGTTKVEMNDIILQGIPKDAKILEVGCNTGQQLEGLKRSGFGKLYGVELQEIAVEQSKQLYKGLNIVIGSGFDVPYKDNFFDMVYTSGVLIHIAPSDLKAFMSEMVRCSNKYIMGFEYYNESLVEIPYRGHGNRLWKTDYAKLFLEYFPELEMVASKKYKYVENPMNEDMIYLLKKKS